MKDFLQDLVKRALDTLRGDGVLPADLSPDVQIEPPQGLDSAVGLRQAARDDGGRVDHRDSSMRTGRRTYAYTRAHASGYGPRTLTQALGERRFLSILLAS